MSLIDKILADNLTALLSGNIEATIINAEKSIAVKNVFIAFHKKIYAEAYTTSNHPYLLSLTNLQLVNLIKFITIFEKRLFFRGSVSLVPQLISKSKERDLDGYEELINTVIGINDGANPYVPFGFIRYKNCKSLKDYEAKLLEDEVRKGNGEEDAEFRHKVRLELQKIKDAKNIWNAIRRKDISAIKEMANRGLDFNAANEDGLTIQQALAKQEISL